MKTSKILKIDYHYIITYISLGTIILLLYKFDIINQDTINSILLGFGLVGSLLLLSFYSERLRVFIISLIWSIIALIQILIYFSIKSNTDFDNKIGGTYLDSLFFLPSTLIVYQLLRYFFKLYFEYEIIINLRRYQRGEIIDNRKVTWMDTLFSIFGMMLIVFSPSIINTILKFL